MFELSDFKIKVKSNLFFDNHHTTFDNLYNYNISIAKMIDLLFRNIKIDSLAELLL